MKLLLTNKTKQNKENISWQLNFPHRATECPLKMCICIKLCQRVYSFFILIPFVVFYKLFKDHWASFLREEGGLLNPFQILISE